MKNTRLILILIFLSLIAFSQDEKRCLDIVFRQELFFKIRLLGSLIYWSEGII